jgi:hypothetical protein
VTHSLSEFGATNELTTATFYKQQYLDDQDEEVKQLKIEFNYANMQSVLLAIGCMFFVVGSTLEYSKHSDMVITGIIATMGMIKTYVG